MSYEYFRGNLAAVRAELSQKRDLMLRFPNDSRLCDQVEALKARLEASDRAWTDFRLGKVTLVQRRLGEHDYVYLALPLVAAA